MIKIVKLTNGHVAVGVNSISFDEHVKHLIETHGCQIEKTIIICKSKIDEYLEKMRSAPINYKKLDSTDETRNI